MTVTFPTITFPHRGVEVKDAFVLAQEEAQDTLSGAMTDALELFVEQANELELNVTELEQNTIDAYLALIGAANYQGDWSSKGYSLGQSVSYLDASYVCKLTHSSQQVPTNTTYWLLLNYYIGSASDFILELE